MPHLRFYASFVLAAVTCPDAVLAQQPIDTQEPARLERLEPWRIPIHTAADDPVGGAYGTWASGATFKVSFQDGFAFYPVLGRGHPDNLPLKWTTVDVRVGEQSLMVADEEPEPFAQPWRYEYRRTRFTEAYDVLPAGVEQTFVIHRRPYGTGDLIVTGAVSTALVAGRRTPTHGPLAFSDADGDRILEYGAAQAFDRAGRRTSVRTGFDGARITLTVPAAWLDDAEYPITIDPLTSTTLISSYDDESYPPIDVCRSDRRNRLLITIHRHVSRYDEDVSAIEVDDSFRGKVPVLSDVTASWSSEHAQCCQNSFVRRWVVAMERHYKFSFTSRVLAYLHDEPSSVLNSGRYVFVTPPTGYQDMTPSVGGTGSYAQGTNVLLAWRRDSGQGWPNTSRSRAYAAIIDVRGAGSVQPEFLLKSALTADQESPNVSKESLGGDWMVVWQEFDGLSSRATWSVAAALVSPAGARLGTGSFGSATAVDRLNPIVAGVGDRWLCVYTEATVTATEGAVVAQRADWSGSGPMVKLPPRTLYTPSPIPFPPGRTHAATDRHPRSIAMDTNTRSHWTVGIKVWGGALPAHGNGRLYRVGSSGCVLEEPNIDALSSAVAFDTDGQRFALVTLDDFELRGQHVIYPNAGWRSYGTICDSSVYCTNGIGNIPPYAGSDLFRIHLRDAVPDSPYTLFMATAPGDSPFAACRLLLGGVIQPLFSGTTNSSGELSAPVVLSDCPVFIGGFYAQWISARPSNAVQVEVR